MSKKVKNILIIILLAISIVLIDMQSVIILNVKPFFSIKENNYYNALFYKVYSCYNKMYIKGINQEFDCLKIDKLGFTIEDNQRKCQGEKELIYQDTFNNYYLPCEKSDDVLIVIKEDKTKVKDALKEEKISIEDLKQSGLELIIEERINLNIKASESDKTTIVNETMQNIDYNLYQVGLDETTIAIDEVTYTLKRALTTSLLSFEDFLKYIEDNTKKKESEEITIYQNKNYRLVKCNEKNYYLGNNNLDNSICQ